VVNLGPPDTATRNSLSGPVDWFEDLLKQKRGDFFIVVGWERSDQVEEDSMKEGSLCGFDDTVERMNSIDDEKEPVTENLKVNNKKLSSPGSVYLNGQFYAQSPHSETSSLIILPRKPVLLTALSRAKATKTFAWDIISYDFDDLHEYHFPDAPRRTQIGTATISEVLTPSTSSLSMFVLEGQLRGFEIRSTQSSFLLPPDPPPSASTFEVWKRNDLKLSLTFHIWEQYCSLMEACVNEKGKWVDGEPLSTHTSDLAKYVALMKQVSCQDLKYANM